MVVGWDELKRINQISLLPKDYKANKLLFQIAIGLIAVFLVLAGLSLPKDRAYFKCSQMDGTPSIFAGSTMPCDNPFYRANPCPFVDALGCSKEFVAPGEVLGSQPGLLYSLALPTAAFIAFLAVALNHLLYNRGYFKRNKKRIIKALESVGK